MPSRCPSPISCPDELRAAIVLFYSLLDEKQRRLYAGLEALKTGYGGDTRIAELLGLDRGTVARGRRELLQQEGLDTQRVRSTGAGRHRVEKKTPGIVDRITEIMEHETAGDPVTGLRWTHKTTAKVAAELCADGIEVSPSTVARLLKQMGFSLRVNHKKLARVCKVAPQDRDAQFEHIAKLRNDFAARNLPVISIDTKKKELIGRFKNPGAAWGREPVEVRDHDFLSEAVGKAIPYGIYDVQANLGTVCVGTSRETPEFAVDAIYLWWLQDGRRRYPQAKTLALLADCGGANGPNNRAWKWALNERLVKRLGLSVTVAHYPPGASKWNPIEHRLFSEISKNWAGRPLESWQTMLNYIRTTTTKTGLAVQAHLVDRPYEKIKVTDAQIKALPITRHERLSKWNYTLSPSY